MNRAYRGFSSQDKAVSFYRMATMNGHNARLIEPMDPTADRVPPQLWKGNKVVVEIA